MAAEQSMLERGQDSPCASADECSTTIDARLDSLSALLEAYDSDADLLGAASLDDVDGPSVGISGWRVAGYDSGALNAGQSPFDWLTIAEGQLLAAVGSWTARDAALALPHFSSSWESAGRARDGRSAPRLIERLAAALASVVAHGERASLWCATVEPSDGAVRCAAVGNVVAVRLHDAGCEPLVSPTRPFAGAGMGTRFAFLDTRIAPGETLLAVSGAAAGWRWDGLEVFRVLERHREGRMACFARAVGERVADTSPQRNAQSDDSTRVVAIHRARSSA